MKELSQEKNSNEKNNNEFLFDALLMGSNNDILNEIFDFPLNNLGKLDFSKENFVPEELFPDTLLEIKKQKSGSNI